AAGHADPAVRVTNTIRTIGLLNEHGYIGHETASTLRDSYNFLRQLIDALRVVRDNAKDLAIPPESSREFNYLAHRLRFDSPSALQEAINLRMSSARYLWANSAPPPLYVP
ncbi:MAG: hypothetical protein Q7O66_04690, partial [Dehalococcoidia bacterium]|nr:hypothetical protein [Dehalococcoidia bacterium]